MAFTLSLQDVAIAAAIANKTLTLVQRKDRWGDDYVAINDEHGIIEVADDGTSAMERVREVQMRMKEKKPGN